jgi:predicted CDP-diglyceride synthetase/phosphatidate cytidylyltransferase
MSGALIIVIMHLVLWLSMKETIGYIKINLADPMTYLFTSIYYTLLMIECYELHKLYEIDNPVESQTPTKVH